MYQNIYFQFQKTSKQTKTKTRIQKSKKKLNNKREYLQKFDLKNKFAATWGIFFSSHSFSETRAFFIFYFILLFIFFYFLFFIFFFWPKYNDVLSLMCFHSHYIDYTNFIRDLLIPLLPLANDFTHTKKASVSVKSSKQENFRLIHALNFHNLVSISFRNLNLLYL